MTYYPRSEDPPTIGILILNWNGREWLAPLYESIQEQRYPRARVYLVDNASDDGSVELTVRNYPDVTVLRLSQNMGYCMAYNVAMPYALADGCEYIIWANHDVKLEPECLHELARAAKKDSGIGVLGPAFFAWESDEPNEYMRGNHPHAIPAMKARLPKPIDVDWVEGSFLMVRRECVEAVGPLDPYLRFYWEETDFCRRARFLGWRAALVPTALARHYGGGSQINRETKLICDRLRERNYYIYKLADPFRNFSRNILNSFHLFLVHIKQCLPQSPALAVFHFRIFASVLWRLRTVHRKWTRDRLGKHPPNLQPGVPLPTIEIIENSFGASPDRREKDLTSNAEVLQIPF